jgi:hypothetical protein
MDRSTRATKPEMGSDIRGVLTVQVLVEYLQL